MKNKKIRLFFIVTMTILVCSLLIFIFLLNRSSEKEKSLNVVSQTPQYVFTYAENQAANHPAAKGAERFAELVEKKSNGRIKIKIFTDAELGDEKSVFKQMQYGGIDFARVSVMNISETVPEMNVLQLPYIYRNTEHMWKVLDGEIGSEFMGYLQGTGVTGLSWYDAGSRHFYNSVRPIETLEDIKGLKIRVAESYLMQEMITALDAEPMSMEYFQVYSALEKGIIDGAENNWSSYETKNHYKVAKYITIDSHNRIPELQLVSDVTWEKLSPEDRELIKECAKESALYQRIICEQYEQEAQERAIIAGCQVTVMSEKEQLRLRRVLMVVYPKIGNEYIDLINKIAEVI